MASSKELKGKLTLDIGGFRASMRAASAVAATNAAQMRTIFRGAFVVPTNAIKAGFSSIVGMASSAASKIKAVFSAVGIAGLIAGTIGTAVSLGGSISKAADFETATLQFQTLLGSAEAAQKRLKELAKFAAETPFELPEILAASKTLQVFTKGALATGKGLTLIGDIAASVNQPFQDVAFWIGRMYDALSNGRPAGEAFARLQEMGAISGDLRSQLEKMGEAKKPVAEIWASFAAGTSKFSGGMKTLSGSFSGLMSTLSDTFGQLQREFGLPIIESLKPVISWAIQNLDSLTSMAQAAGKSVGNFIKGFFDAAQKGNLADFLFGEKFGAKVTDAISFVEDFWKSIKGGEGFDYLWQSLMVGFSTVSNYVIGLIETGVEILGQTIAAIFSADFVSGLAQTFIGLAQIFGGALLTAFQDPLIFIQAGLEFAFVQAGKVLYEALEGVAPLMDLWLAPMRLLLEKISGLKIPSIQQEISDVLPGLQENSKRTFGETLEKRRNEGLNFAGYNPKELLGIGLESLKAGGGSLAQVGKDLSPKVMESVRNFQPSDYFDAVGMPAAAKLAQMRGLPVPKDAADWIGAQDIDHSNPYQMALDNQRAEAAKADQTREAAQPKGIEETASNTNKANELLDQIAAILQSGLSSAATA